MRIPECHNSLFDPAAYGTSRLSSAFPAFFFMQARSERSPHEPQARASFGSPSWQKWTAKKLGLESTFRPRVFASRASDPSWTYPFFRPGANVIVATEQVLYGASIYDTFTLIEPHSTEKVW
jgi:hypothetical protein